MLNPQITNEGRWNALLVDDLHDSGATLDEACRVLRTYEKIGSIYVATMTWKWRYDNHIHCWFDHH